MRNTNFMAGTLQGSKQAIDKANQVANIIAGSLIVSFTVVTMLVLYI